MISKEVYLEMKELVKEYEANQLNIDSTDNVEKPYLVEISIKRDFKYNPKFGDNRACECGHTYYRHFDTYEEMLAVGCKYCGCIEFKTKSS